MKKDVRTGTIIVLAGMVLYFISPLVGFAVFAVAGTFFIYGLFLIVNAMRKRKADKLSEENGFYCYGKVLRILPYGEEKKGADNPDASKFVSVLVYDEGKDDFVIVSDVMEKSQIDFIVGDYIAVQFYVNDFNYINNLHSKNALPGYVIEKFDMLFRGIGVELKEQPDSYKNAEVDTTNWTITEEAYPNDIALKEGNGFEREDEDKLVEKILLNVESVSALKEFDAGRASKLANRIAIGVVLVMAFGLVMLVTFMKMYFG